MDNAVSWVKHHPVPAIIAAAVIFYLFSRLFGGSNNAASNNSNAVAAYYAASAAQAQAGDALQATQIQAQAQTAQTLIAGQTSVTNNTTWANTDLAETQSNNATQVAIAPYQAQASIVNALSNVASTPGSIVTSTKKSNGFFGIGGGSKTTSTYVPDPAAVNASDLLSEFLNGANGFHPAH